MKKIFTLLTAMLLATCVYAQVKVVDSKGNACQNGGVMEIYSEETIIVPTIPPIISLSSPILVNTGSSKVSVSMDVNVRQLPEGTSFNDCFSGVCVNYDKTGSHTTAIREIAPNAELETQIEWNNQKQDRSYAEGTCIADFTLYVDGTQYMTFTVKYIHGVATAVKELPQTPLPNATFTLDGKRVGDNAKGLVIHNGKKVIKL